MKVLILNVDCKHSSTGKIVYDQFKYLHEQSHEAVVCYGRGSQIEESGIFKFSSNVEVIIHALLTRLTGFTGNYSPFATRKLIKIINQYQPDIVHIHEIHAYFVNLVPVIKYLKKKNIRTIWTFHCEFMYTGKCGHAHDCEKWKTECGRCPQVREYPTSYFLDFTRHMFRTKKKLLQEFQNLTIITPSNWLANRVNQSFLRDKDIRVIYNGIDTQNIFYPRDYAELKSKYNINDNKVVLAVAPNMMSELKGGRWALELAKKFEEEKVTFILVGVDKINFSTGSNVIVLGRTKNQEELARFYSMADVTLMLSMKETFSLVCAESLACGTPIIGFEAGAPSEIIPEGYGIFIPYGDLDGLYHNIKSFFDNRSLLWSDEKCAEYGKNTFSKSNMLQSYLDLYKE